MSRLFRRLTCLTNLAKANNPKGQIATLLILFMVIALIFVMATVNIGQVATTSTTLSNAADAAALQLASSLVTKARAISDGLYSECHRRFKCCVETGLAAGIFALVLAVIAVFLCQPCLAFIASIGIGAAVGTTFTLTTFVATGAVAGMIGGAIGGAYAGTGVVEGMVTGLAIGASVGLAGAGIAGAPMTAPAAAPAGGAAGGGAGGASLGVSTGLTSDAGIMGSGFTPVTLAPATLSVPAAAAPTLGVSGLVVDAGIMAAAASLPVATLGTGAVILGALSTASKLGSDAIAEQNWKDLYREMSNDVNKLKEKDRYRENAFITALSLVVDDPNKSQDTYDINRNGDTAELVSDFFIWLHRRHEKFNSLRQQETPRVRYFLNGPARNFRNFAEKTYTGTNSSYYNGTTYSRRHNPGMLEKLEYEWYLDSQDDTYKVRAGTDGSIVTLLRGFWNNGTRFTIDDNGPKTAWEPGPVLVEYDAWVHTECGDGPCPAPPAGMDYIDGLADKFRDMVLFIDSLKSDIESAALTWENWIWIFYDEDDPNNTGTYYGKLKKSLEMLQSIRQQILSIRDSAPLCIWGYYEDPANRRLRNVDPTIPCLACPAPVPPATKPPACSRSCYTNFPCRFSAAANSGYTVDADRFDEFAPALRDLNQLIDRQIPNFMAAIVDLNSRLNAMAMTGSAMDNYGGLNPLKYEWVDTAGRHKVIVQAGPFRVPRLRTEDHGNFISGETCNELVDYRDRGNCWIRVTRDDTSPDIGLLGKWNPFKRPIAKRSKAEYGYRDNKWYLGLKEI